MQSCIEKFYMSVNAWQAPMSHHLRALCFYHRNRTYLERECLVGLAWAVSEKIPARLYITIGLVAAY